MHMGWLPDAPAVVLVAITLAAALLLVEIALPTFGVAGTTALALTAVALVSASDQGHPWWPLLAVAAAVCLWAALLTVRRPPPMAQVLAGGLFALGGVAYGLLARDPATVVLAAAGSVGLPFAFGPLLKATNCLRELPPQTGMEALVGRTALVVHWDGLSGTCRIDGSLWNARGPGAIMPGTEVVVTGYRRMTVDVAVVAPAPEGPFSAPERVG